MPHRRGGLGIVACCRALRNIVYNIDKKELKILSPYGGPGSNPGSGTTSSSRSLVPGIREVRFNLYATMRNAPNVAPYGTQCTM